MEKKIEINSANWIKRTMDYLYNHHLLCLGIFCILTILSIIAGFINYPDKQVMEIVLYVENVLFYLWSISVLLLLIVSIGMLFAEKRHGCLLLIANFSVIVIGFIIMVFSSIFMSDPYAIIHPIPEGLKYDIPLDEDMKHKKVHDLVVESDSTSWLQVITDYYGSFAYTFYYPELERGMIFLRCFEAGTGEQLSEPRLYGQSSKPSETGKDFHCHVNNKWFTIYEGNPHEYYVARFEVWFRAEKDGKERKLLEKYYRVDGFER